MCLKMYRTIHDAITELIDWFMYDNQLEHGL